MSQTDYERIIYLEKWVSDLLDERNALRAEVLSVKAENDSLAAAISRNVEVHHALTADAVALRAEVERLRPFYREVLARVRYGADPMNKY